MEATTRQRRCVRCGSSDAIPIVYGLPTWEAVEEAQRGQIVLGGCVIGHESPAFECAGCGAALPWVRDESRADD